MVQTAQNIRLLDKQLSAKLKRLFGEFLKSTIYKEKASKKDKVGSRLRSMKSDYKKDVLSDKRVLLLFADLEILQDIELTEFIESKK